jgi:hypothetical protein
MFNLCQIDLRGPLTLDQSVKDVPGPYRQAKTPTPPPFLLQPHDNKQVTSKKPISTYRNKGLTSTGDKPTAYRTDGALARTSFRADQPTIPNPNRAQSQPKMSPWAV